MSDDKNISRLLEEAAERQKAQMEEDWEGAPPVEDAGAQALSDSLKSTRAIINGILVVFALFLAKSLFFTVPSQETAVIRRFGKPVTRGESVFLEPGLHWRLPSPIDEVVRVPLNEQQSTVSSVGWYFMNEAERAAALARDYNPPGKLSLVPGRDGYTITSDANVLHIEATMRYRVQNPEAFAFDFSDADKLVQNALNSALFHASVEFTVDAALDRKNDVIQSIQSKAQDILDRMRVGVTIEQLTANIEPPTELRTIFAQALTASQEYSQTIEQARGEVANLLARARGDKEAIIDAAEAESEGIVSSVEAEAGRFADLLDDYRADPRLLSSRLLYESVSTVYRRARDKFLFMDDAGAGGQLRLQLNKQPRYPQQSNANSGAN